MPRRPSAWPSRITKNIPTDDPHKAVKWMAWTAMNAEELKRESGSAKTGRACARPVFSFSLAWHPEEQPGDDRCRQAGADRSRPGRPPDGDDKSLGSCSSAPSSHRQRGPPANRQGKQAILFAHKVLEMGRRTTNASAARFTATSESRTTRSATRARRSSTGNRNLTVRPASPSSITNPKALGSFRRRLPSRVSCWRKAKRIGPHRQ